MEEFLLTREPLNIVRISTALFVRVEQGKWTGVLEKEVENFENVLERVLEQVPSEDVERKKKLQSFGTGKKLAKQVRAISYIHVKYIDMMYFFRFSKDIVGSHCIYASECANVRCDIITSRMAVASYMCSQNIDH